MRKYAVEVQATLRKTLEIWSDGDAQDAEDLACNALLEDLKHITNRVDIKDATSREVLTNE